jgi:hypothetical protein
VAITFVNVGAGTPAGTTTSATTTAITPPLPTNTAIGDRVYIFTAASNTATVVPSSWTTIFRNVAVGTVGTTAGAGTGQRFISAFYRDRDTTWTMPSVVLTSATNNSHAACAVTLRKDAADTWNAPTFTAAAHDTTDGTGYSVTSPSWAGVTGGWIFSVTGLNDNVTSSTPGGTSTGMTLGTRTERYDNGTATGNDVQLVVADAPVTAGGTGTITRTATLSAASQGGTAWVQQTVTSPADTTAPTVPTGLTATPSAGQVDLSWTASTDAVGVDSYRVRRDGADLTGATALTGVAYTDTAVTAGASYSYTVSAVDAAGNRSAESTAATATVPSGGGAPQTPSRVQSAVSTNYQFAQTSTYTAPAWGTSPTAGNLLLFCAAIDKAGGPTLGSITAGWTVRAYQNGLSGTTEGVTILVATKTAAGGDAPPTITWTANSTTGGGANGILQEWSGVDTTTPLSPIVIAPYTGTTVQSISAGPLTPDLANGRVMAFFCTDSMPSGQPASAFSPAATGWTANQLGAAAISTGAGTPGAALIERTAAPVAGTAVPATTFTWTNTADESQAVMFVLRGAGGGGGTPTPTLVSRTVGIPGPTSAYVKTETTDAAQVHLRVATNSGMTTGVLNGVKVIPDALSIAQPEITGLSSGTRYFYRVVMTDGDGVEVVDTASVVGEFSTAPVGQANFAFSFASCCNAADSASMAAVAARRDAFFLHIGDMFYADASGTTLANIRTKLRDKVLAPNHAAAFSVTPMDYVPSDHDAANNGTNAGADATAWTNWNQARRDVLPVAADLPATTGVYGTFVWGRVRFIKIDRRSFATIPSATDNATKTSLGATQKQWLKDQITAATEPVIIIVNPDPWVGAAQVGDDGWFGYTTERTELANFFIASGKNIAMTAGDMHAVAAHDGVSGSPGNIAVFHGAPLNNAASQKGGPYTVGPYPATGTATVDQYARIVVTDTGSQISLAYTGYSSDNTVRATLTKTYTLAADVTSSASDVAGATDTVTTTLTAARSATDTADATDSASTTLTANRATTDAAGATDSHSWSADVVRPATDTAGAADVASTTLTAARSAVDTAGASDTATWSADVTRPVVDTAGASDVASATLDAQRAATSTAGASDAVTVAVDYVRTATSGAGAVDSVSTTLAQGQDRAASSSAGASDQVSTALDAQRSAASAAGAVDSVAVAIDYVRTASSGAGATDTASASLAAVRSATSIADAVDAASAAQDLTRSAASTAGAVDAAARTLDATRSASSTADARDEINVSAAGQTTLTATSSAGTTDAVAVIRNVVINVSSGAGAVDTVTTAADVQRSVSSTAGAVDAASTSAAAGIDRSAVSTAGATDAVSTQLDSGRAAVSTAGATDNVTWEMARVITRYASSNAGAVDEIAAVRDVHLTASSAAGATDVAGIGRALQAIAASAAGATDTVMWTISTFRGAYVVRYGAPRTAATGRDGRVRTIRIAGQLRSGHTEEKE